MKRRIGDIVRINPYAMITGTVITTKHEDQAMKFDYKVKLNIPVVTKETAYSASYNKEEDYWWNYFDEKELDILERNFEMVTR